MHNPVMLKNTIKNLDIKINSFYIDLTYGAGGHSNEIKRYIKKYKNLIMTDKCKKAYKSSLTNIKNSFNINYENFAKINNLFKVKIYDGVISDIGISTNQLSKQKNGIFRKNNNILDMRINKKEKIRAFDWINKVDKKNLICITNFLSNKKIAIKFSKKLINLRKNISFFTTNDLKLTLNINKIFNIIRIFVNNELKSLLILLKNINCFIKNNGTYIIITFNSLEYNLIKNYIKKNKRSNTEKKISLSEIEKNISSRSAIMINIKY